MAVIVGADGYKAQWLAVSLDTMTGRLTTSVVATEALPALGFDVLAIDIPIGLSSMESRDADVAARKFVGPRRASSIFPSPILPALPCSRRLEAADATLRVCGKRVSAQGFALFPKIRAIRQLLAHRPDLAGKVFEVHPEVSFRALACRTLEYYKKTPEGMAERQNLIAKHFGSRVFAELRAKSKVRLPDDDLADAFAALWSAGRILQEAHESLPINRGTDSAGFPLNIWY
jgi:predicted RNase H-like nuclease